MQHKWIYTVYKTDKRVKGHPAAGLTWTRAPSCSLRSSRQTPWTFSGCTRASSHTFRRWCSERPLAFPTSKLKTEEKIHKEEPKKEDWRHHGERDRRQEIKLRMLLCLFAEEPIQSLTHNPSAVSTGQRPLNEPEQPITNNRAETFSAFCFLCRFSALTKEGFGVFGRLTKLDGNKVGWRNRYYLYKMLYCLEVSVAWHKFKADWKNPPKTKIQKEKCKYCTSMKFSDARYQGYVNARAAKIASINYVWCKFPFNAHSTL